ncbi:hypothetical protein GLAREA_12450 [Glarea lozoyensis ATCC 20868]|uniref:Uncharacterized protein n=1 Tax=Glarea lozoyensis (strain ATCC 20868 / MF5171) TaxID=1116229 RepID=S3D3F9_GLAL2|nr:uncharacterized protein GLAREA_12450 [Glarea lozoyensis ATCC 20868]EPE31694.1 hypothetical protein GLAREA_12450 [Glarea lozoyensis ATCC 20868]
MRFSNCFSLLAAAVFTLVSAEAYTTDAFTGPAPISNIHARVAAQIFSRQNIQDCGNGQHCTNSICCGNINCMPADAQCCTNGQYCLSGGTCMLESGIMKCQHADGTFENSGSDNSGSDAPATTPAPKPSSGEQVKVGLGGVLVIALGAVLLL